MPFKVEAANDADIEKILSIIFLCYGGKNEYINAVFPRALTEEGHKLNVERMLFINSVAPSVFWEKVSDGETGQIVGGAMWNLCEQQKPPPYDIDGPPGTWESESDKAYAQALQRSFVVDENRLWEDNELPLLGLAMMGISPEFQRKGAGAALLESGLNLADAKQAATILVSNEDGLRLYEKHGFETQNERDLTVPEEFGQNTDVRIWTMIRERKSA
ncbi:hypothetical protein K491DRAFT_760242 [Lophiostoma macrostomum CBS 122681]|uniref:N-acetyltransferase domain-containing protein n=1 Tax=Lophiostoma macrostomum CBS 122681 TaxID=1314788 RepID=A0A6A6SZZ1_9PLEO|nr:hypothetical protein K491DRAFT_760242 [Lophiostoma macrostomum CBS 122681]